MVGLYVECVPSTKCYSIIRKLLIVSVAPAISSIREKAQWYVRNHRMIDRIPLLLPQLLHLQKMIFSYCELLEEVHLEKFY